MIDINYAACICSNAFDVAFSRQPFAAYCLEEISNKSLDVVTVPLMGQASFASLTIEVTLRYLR